MDDERIKKLPLDFCIVNTFGIWGMKSGLSVLSRLLEIILLQTDLHLIVV